ncbi:hypothetical protein GOBAR_AA12729 [Gossypium barbadense]|uniref:Uncharacterized protein n=1 Tax=Gossypium barbadense TaxID=3634 RepID=A0A2P5XX64_GOSBA|nr:hypothetical protein GOBAR_AA12729 [Gossypium barbadense]
MFKMKKDFLSLSMNRGKNCELTLRVGDETITLQARNSGNTMEIEGDHLNHSTKPDNMVQPSLQEMSLKEVHEPFSSNSRGSIHKDQRLQIEELDEWRTHKPRTPDKSNLRQNKLNPFPNQLKVRDRVLLDATDPHIVATTSNEEIPLTVLSFFPFGTIEVSHSKFGSFKVPCRLHEERKLSYLLRRRERERHLPRCCIDWATVEQVQLADAIRALLTTDPWELFFGIIELTYLKLMMELCSMFHLQTVMTNYDDPDTIQFCLGGLVRQLSISEFGDTLGLYTEEFKEENELHAVTRHIHFSPPEGGERALASSTLTTPTSYGHEDPPTQPPPPSRLAHVAASYVDISERLTRFEQ